MPRRGRYRVSGQKGIWLVEDRLSYGNGIINLDGLTGEQSDASPAIFARKEDARQLKVALNRINRAKDKAFRYSLGVSTLPHVNRVVEKNVREAQETVREQEDVVRRLLEKSKQNYREKNVEFKCRNP